MTKLPNTNRKEKRRKTGTHMDAVTQTAWGRYIADIERRAIERAQDLSPLRGLALEVGCEGGRWSKVLADSGWRMVCIDIKPHLGEVLRKRIPDARYILVSPSDHTFPVESNSVQMLVCIEVWQVIHADWFADEASRILGTGDLVVGVVTNAFCWRGLPRRISKRLLSRKAFSYDNLIYRISYNKWKRRMEEKGLKIVHEEGFCWLPFSRKSNFVLVPFLVKLERYLGLRRFPALSPWVAFVACKR